MNEKRVLYVFVTAVDSSKPHEAAAQRGTGGLGSVPALPLCDCGQLT